ncbi:PREDICTED: uncharacterized protein LOC104607167 isoform X2 [Nelumbo nucifera]|uniref:Uncharacterized protein LOC104607167 isoform X2 n=1 Tax=Nelumbo nucifera TaxID=4432 RepID=A0A1U8B4K0_NELNU|nr:PREDICTED: uncharacterized protein LOC104607167 isoform X2 [Nelumbo nucifera]
MKHELSTTITTEAKPSFSQPTTPYRLTTSSKAKHSPTSAVSTRLSPGLKPRPGSAPPYPNYNAQKVRRSLGLNKQKSGEHVAGLEKGREADDVGIVGRSLDRPVFEQFAKPRRRIDLSVTVKRVEDDPDGKKKELQEKLLASENLVKDLQSEISALKNHLEKLQTLNLELESQNRQYAKDLIAAEEKISAFSSGDKFWLKKEFIEEKVQIPQFKDVQKLIANKLEHFSVKKAIKEGNPDKTPSAMLLHTVTEALNVPQKSLVNFVPLPPTLPVQQEVLLKSVPPPPPPPPPHMLARTGSTQKAPEIVEFYHSLTKREGKKDTVPGNRSNYAVNNAHSSIVGEIQNRSAHLLAIKADVETKGEFIKFLIQKVQEASYTDIEDNLKFVDWLDGELSSLVDERAVLKHFNWPERKADAMRESAVEYRDLKILESELSSYKDDNKVPCETALKKMGSLLDRSERSIQKLIKLRDSAMLSYRDCKVPTDWMHDSGMINKEGCY